MVAKGEFVWGHVVCGPGHDDDTPCSDLVARMLSLIDGRLTVGEIADRLKGHADRTGDDPVLAATVAAVEILYVDGTIEMLDVGAGQR